jgi:GNAT superfamily N-acetyltransferase
MKSAQARLADRSLFCQSGRTLVRTPADQPNDGNSRARLISIRDEMPHDLDLLFATYGSTREEELNATGWDAKTRAAFLRMQFQAQRSSYARMFPKAQFSIVLVDDQFAGRLVLNRSGIEIRVVDLALLPVYRGRGIGSELLRRVLVEARRERLPVRLHAIKDSREYRWYLRLGFSSIAQSGPYAEMEWMADG